MMDNSGNDSLQELPPELEIDKLILNSKKKQNNEHL
jgi:hypothetical protein